ncbi:MAG: hypothetical protein AAGA56_04490 [Myxococcota bacterium]
MRYMLEQAAPRSCTVVTFDFSMRAGEGEAFLGQAVVLFQSCCSKGAFAFQ